MKKNCSDCGDEFESKSARAKYCTECRESREQSYWERKSKKDFGTCVCKDCGELKPRPWEAAEYCYQCFLSYKEAKEEIEKLLKPEYFTRFIEGELVVLKEVISAKNHRELREKIRNEGLESQLLALPEKEE